MKARGTSGAVAIEFALVGLVFISLLLLAMETGWQLLIEFGAGRWCQGSKSLRQHGHHGGSRNNSGAP